MSDRIELDVLLVAEQASLPSQAYAGDGAFDLHAADDAVLAPLGRAIISCGVAVAIPEGHAGLVLPRSGLAARHGVTLLNSPGLIDAGYRGQIRVVLINFGDEEFNVSRGDRVAQLMIIALPEVHLRAVDVLPEGARGEGGFGSSGR